MKLALPRARTSVACPGRIPPCRNWHVVLGGENCCARVYGAGASRRKTDREQLRSLPALAGRSGTSSGRSDPYGSDVTREIQTGFYGPPLNPQSPSDPTDQVAFAYPLYVVFLLAPTVALPFRLAMEIFRWGLLSAIACSVPLWMYAIGFRPRRTFVLSGMVLAVGSFPAVQEFHMQNLTALVVLLLAAAAAAAARGWLVLSGSLFALSTIKPQLSGLLILWLMLWAMGRSADANVLLGASLESWRFSSSPLKGFPPIGSGDFSSPSGSIKHTRRTRRSCGRWFLHSWQRRS